MLKRKPTKPPEGAAMKDTPDMIAWRKEFEEMDLNTHLKKLKELGLDDEDLNEFKEMETMPIKDVEGKDIDFDSEVEIENKTKSNKIKKVIKKK
ncbi:MAG: hypothetical protein PHQ98_00075 [Candidatus ainarchaeum sp.]|nr:hypothetical protein [Candidatus ainarchaeum sp.]